MVLYRPALPQLGGGLYLPMAVLKPHRFSTRGGKFPGSPHFTCSEHRKAGQPVESTFTPAQILLEASQPIRLQGNAEGHQRMPRPPRGWLRSRSRHVCAASTGLPPRTNQSELRGRSDWHGTGGAAGRLPMAIEQADEMTARYPTHDKRDCAIPRTLSGFWSEAGLGWRGFGACARTPHNGATPP